MELTVLGVLGAALGGYAVLRFVRAYFGFRGRRLIICPETRHPAGVDLAAGRAARTSLFGRPSLRLRDCSRWPERAGCGQDCLSQIVFLFASLAILGASIMSQGCDDNPAGVGGVQIMRVVPGSALQITRRDTPEHLESADLPDWSPDGKRIAFVGHLAPQEIWTVSLVDGSLEQVTDYMSYDPCWSSDGIRIAFTITRGESSDYYAAVLSVPAGGGAADTLTPPSMHASSVAWSPRGRTIAVHAYSEGNSDIWRIDLNGEPPKRLTTGAEDDVLPAWSSDGRMIAYASRQGQHFDIFTISTRGESRKQLTTTSNNEWFPTWSPNGKWIAFESDQSGNGDIWVVPAAGGAPVQLTDDPAFDGRPDWAPDGSKIAFLSLRAGGWDIWTIDVEEASNP